MVAIVAERLPHKAPQHAPLKLRERVKKDPSRDDHTPRVMPLGKLRLINARAAKVHDLREQRRARVAMQAWIVDDTQSMRGYALDLSDGGARVGGVGTRIPVGARVVLKIKLEPTRVPIAMRAHVVRYDFVDGIPTIALRFLEVAWDDAFDIGRVIDAAMKTAR
jgi:hypothetical protein